MTYFKMTSINYIKCVLGSINDSEEVEVTILKWLQLPISKSVQLPISKSVKLTISNWFN